MARIKSAVTTRRRHNKILKLAKGYWGARSKHFRVANQAVMKSLQYAYVSRRLKKRDFRRLWITRISAGVQQYGLNYSRFMYALKKMNLNLNRKVLAEMAVYDKAAFAAVVEKAKTVL
jgi:large subunit ribosomal protein L20